MTQKRRFSLCICSQTLIPSHEKRLQPKRLIFTEIVFRCCEQEDSVTHIHTFFLFSEKAVTWSELLCLSTMFDVNSRQAILLDPVHCIILSQGFGFERLKGKQIMHKVQQLFDCMQSPVGRVLSFSLSPGPVDQPRDPDVMPEDGDMPL